MPPLTDRQLSLSLKTKHTRFPLIFAYLSSSVSFPDLRQDYWSRFPDLSYKWLFFLCFSCRPFLYIYISLPTHIPVYFLITVGVYFLIAEGRISVFSHYSVDAMPKRGLGRCSSTFVGICPSLNVCVFLWFRSFPTVFWFVFADFSALGSSGCLFHLQFQAANNKFCIPCILCSRTCLCPYSVASLMPNSLWPHGL